MSRTFWCWRRSERWKVEIRTRDEQKAALPLKPLRVACDARPCPACGIEVACAKCCHAQPPFPQVLTCMRFSGYCTLVIAIRSEEHTSELQSHVNLVCRLLLEKTKKKLTHVQRLHEKMNRQTNEKNNHRL